MEEDTKSTSDVFTQLPDEILHNILSWVSSSKQRVTCSVLSKRWHSIIYSYPYLDFDMYEFLKYIPDSGVFSPGHDEARAKFFKYIESTVLRFCESNLRPYRFRLCVQNILEEEKACILRCVHLLSAKALVELELNMIAPSTPIVIPPTILSGSSLTNLCMCGCHFSSYSLLNKAQKMLTLENVPLTDEFIQQLSINFPSLEQLSLKLCSGMKEFYLCGSPCLRVIEFIHTSEVKRIDIKAPNLYQVSLHLCELVDDSDEFFEGTSINITACKNLVSVTLYGYTYTELKCFASSLISFQFLERLHLSAIDEFKSMRLCSNSLKTIQMDNIINLDEIELEIGTPELMFSQGQVLFTAPNEKACLSFNIWDQTVDTLWFEKLGRFFRNTKMFHLLILDIHQDVYVKHKISEIQSPLWELERVELYTDSLNSYQSFISLIDDMLSSCCPMTLTWSAHFCRNNFDNLKIIEYTYEKIMCGCCQKIEITIAYGRRCKLKFNDIRSLLEARPCHLSMTKIKFKKHMIMDCANNEPEGAMDLQDQSMACGADRGLFTEINRRSFAKNIGPLVKSVREDVAHIRGCSQIESPLLDKKVLSGGETPEIHSQKEVKATHALFLKDGKQSNELQKKITSIVDLFVPFFGQWVGNSWFIRYLVNGCT